MVNNQNLSILNPNSSVSLDKNYANIGKWVGSGIFKQKVLLYRDKKNEWKIVKYNFLQMFFRNFFGGYKKTHLDKIFKSLSKESSQKEKEASTLYQRIAKVWAEKYVKWVGNTPSNQANVICFGEEHGDIAYRSIVKQFINKNYQKGDIVLIERAKAGEVIDPEKSQLTRGLNKDCLVMGWEPQNFKEITEGGLASHHAKCDELKDLVRQIEQAFPEKSSSYDEERIKKKCEEIGNKILELNKYFQSDSPKVLNIHQNLLAFQKIFFKNKSDNPNKLMKVVILESIVKLEEKQEKMLYKNLTNEESNLLIKNAHLRDSSLIQEIHKNRREGKRIFVIGGMGHFICTHVSETKVKKELAKHKFTILGRKTLFNQWAQFNKDISQMKTGFLGYFT